MDRTSELSGKVVVITGASSGIGRETAITLANKGCDIVATARSEPALESLQDDIAEQTEVTVTTISTDVRDPEAITDLIDSAIELHGKIDIAVLNAGVGRGYGQPVEQLSDTDYYAMQETNVDGVFFSTREILPHLKETQGNLIILGSIAGQYPRAHNPIYAATKWWVRGFASSVQAQAGDEGVRVSVINPSIVRTDWEVDGTAHAERFDEGEALEPREIASAVVFAAEQEYATASSIDLYNPKKLGNL